MGRKESLHGYLGTTFQAKKWLSLDCCGMVCITISYCIHAFAMTVISTNLIYNSITAQIIYVTLYVPATIFAVWSLFMAWTTNPGAVPMGAKPLTTIKRQQSSSSCDGSKETDELTARRRQPQQQRAIRRCHKCNDNFKPARAHHDSVTGRCIVKMDHYCPWVCNAVGALNHKFFVLFIGYTLLSCILSIILITIRFIHCGYYISEEESSSDDIDNSLSPTSTNETITSSTSGSTNSTSSTNETSLESSASDHETEDETLRYLSSSFTNDYCNDLYGNNFFLVAALFVVSITFLIFTCCMLVEQIDAIQTNTGKIARMKMSIGKGGTDLHRVTEEFNEMFGGSSPNVAWHWFIPLKVSFPKGMEKIILGYEFDKSWDYKTRTTPYEEPSHDNDGDNGEENSHADNSDDLENQRRTSSADSKQNEDNLQLSSVANESKGEFSLVAKSSDPVELGQNPKREHLKLRKRDTSPSFVDKVSGELA